jgi:hypothetical protein
MISTAAALRLLRDAVVAINDGRDRRPGHHDRHPAHDRHPDHPGRDHRLDHRGHDRRLARDQDRSLDHPAGNRDAPGGSPDDLYRAPDAIRASHADRPNQSHGAKRSRTSTSRVHANHRDKSNNGGRRRRTGSFQAALFGSRQRQVGLPASLVWAPR